MKIDSGKVATFHYRLSHLEGDLIETSTDGEPTAYLHGYGNIISGLEEHFVGKSAGDTFQATVPPEQAYGLRKDGANQRIPIKHLLTKGKLKPGMVAHIQTEQGARQVIITKVGKFNVDVDTNHPLAGHTLVFDIEVVDVREASPEELAHKHAHGVGGHHH